MAQRGSIDYTTLTSQVLMDRWSGESINDFDHLRNSIIDILTTPIGSRVMRRSYGSNLFFLIDKPINRKTILDFYAATVGALQKWEPRIIVKSVTFDATQIHDGVLQLNMEGYYLLKRNVFRIDHLSLDFFKDTKTNVTPAKYA